MSETERFHARPHEVWPFKGDLGFRRSIESAGTVAAPLLAGFSFTLLVLHLPTLGEKETAVRVGADVRVTETSQDFSALPELAAVALLVARTPAHRERASRDHHALPRPCAQRLSGMVPGVLP